jgi:hypothetical protein
MSFLRTPRPGFELDWLATDLDGHVGLLSTGGQGPVPATVIDHLAELEAAVGRLESLPVLGICEGRPMTGPGDFTFWTEPCRRGIFGFDWGPVADGPYTRLTVPVRPIDVAEIADAQLRNVIRLTRLPLRFAQEGSINFDALGVALFRG